MSTSPFSILHNYTSSDPPILWKIEIELITLVRCFDQAAPVKAAPVKPVKVENGDDDDSDIDLFGSDDDEEAERIKQERLDAYAAKKSKKPALIAKSSILLDVKPVRVLLNRIMRLL